MPQVAGEVQEMAYVDEGRHVIAQGHGTGTELGHVSGERVPDVRGSFVGAFVVARGGTFEVEHYQQCCVRADDVAKVVLIARQVFISAAGLEIGEWDPARIRLPEHRCALA